MIENTKVEYDKNQGGVWYKSKERMINIQGEYDKHKRGVW